MRDSQALLSLSKNPKLAAHARKQRYAGLRGKCCGIRVRGSVPQPQSSSLALPCQILVSVDGCQSLAAFGSCIHWMRAPFRRPITPAGTVGEWVPSGHNRRRRLATRRCDTKRAGTTAVVPATIEWQQCLLHLHFFNTLRGTAKPSPSACQISPIAMQQWGFKHEKSKERKKGCHLWMASFLRFIAANLSLTHAVTAVSPR